MDHSEVCIDFKMSNTTCILAYMHTLVLKCIITPLIVVSMHDCYE